LSRTVCLVTARMASARCPGKALMELLPGEPLLAVLIARMRTSKTVDEVALATSVNPENDAIADLGKSLGVRVFRGDEDDVLKRHIGAAWAFDADSLVRVTGDNPLTDVGTMDALVRLHHERNADYTQPHDDQKQWFQDNGHVLRTDLGLRIIGVTDLNECFR